MGGASATLRHAKILDPLDVSSSIVLGAQVQNAARFIGHSSETRSEFLGWVCSLCWIEDFLVMAKANEFKDPLEADHQLQYSMPSGQSLLVDDRYRSPTHQKKLASQQQQQQNKLLSPSLLSQNKKLASPSSSHDTERTIRSACLDLGTPTEALSPKNILPLLLASLMPMYFRSKSFQNLVQTSLAPSGQIKVHVLPPYNAPSTASTSTSSNSLTNIDEPDSSFYLTSPGPSESFPSLTKPSSLPTNSMTPTGGLSAKLGHLAIPKPLSIPSAIQISPAVESEGIVRLRSTLQQAAELLSTEQFLNYYQEKLRFSHHSSWLSGLLLYLDELPLCISLSSVTDSFPSSSSSSASQPLSGSRKHHYPLIYVNQSFEQTTLFPRHEVIGHDIIGQNMDFLYHPERTEPGQYEKINRALKNQHSVKLALHNKRKDNSVFLNFLAIQPIVIPTRSNKNAQDRRFVLAIQHDMSGREHRLTQDLLAIDLLTHLLPPLLR